MNSLDFAVKNITDACSNAKIITGQYENCLYRTLEDGTIQFSTEYDFDRWSNSVVFELSYFFMLGHYDEMVEIESIIKRTIEIYAD